MKVDIKNYDSSFLYGTAEYGTELFKYLTSSERVDKDDKGFENLRYIIKRNQITSCLSALLDRPSLVLMLPRKPLARAFKVTAMKDPKDNYTTKVFIDVSEIIGYKEGEYVIKNSDIQKFISYLACALNTFIYHTDPSVILNNTQLVNSSTDSFSLLCTNIIDYMRIGGVDNVRQKMLYMSSIYYQLSLLLKDDTPTVHQKAIKLSKLSQRECDILDTQIVPEDYTNIDTFVKAIARVLKVEGVLKLDNFIDKWIFLYGAGTQFATEVPTAFANMLIHAYVGAYLNNQNQIEKLVGRNMVEYCNTLFRVGGEII